MNLRASALLPAAFATAVAAVAVGCEFIASADRSLIPTPDGGIGATGGGGGSGATGGTPTGPGGGGTAGMGGDGGCAASTDCPGMDSFCSKRTCTANECGTEFEATGTPLPDADQVPNDCKTLVCDGNGGQDTEPDTSDLPVDDSDCSNPVCDGDMPGTTNEPDGTDCTQDGGNVCDGEGNCVDCTTAGGGCMAGETCLNEQCVSTMCMDNTKNGMETDIDCGGPLCPGCADGKACMAAGDCISSVCTNMVCVAPTCTDGVENGTETDVDCGGSCPDKCAFQEGCSTNSDCIGGSCVAMTCAATCTDTVKNGSETDVDCGSTCPACGTGDDCMANADCASLNCTGMICLAATCTDNIENGDETDTDCGGSCPNDCADDDSCLVDADCTSGICEAGTCGLNGCTPATATNITAMPTVTFSGTAYTPDCFIVTAGTVVTFNGDFSAHPLVGGKIVAGAEVPAGASSPFFPTTDTGMSKPFTLSTPGRYGFYCDVHGTSGMNGAVFVQ